jgi:hypothetical protein
MRKKGKLPPLPTSDLVMRQIDVSTPTRAVIATENPIERWDDKSQQVINEVLLIDGMELRAGRDQMPIVDSHDDSSVRNILGSIQQLKVDRSTGELYGVPVFASDPDAQTIQARMNEGHITDFSITAQPLESLFIPRGQSFTTARGAVIDGPAVIHTRWQPHNASICATGADEYSTVRRSYTDLNRKVIRMDEALLAQLSGMGLPDGMTDPNQVLAWVVGKLGAEATEEATEPSEPVMSALPDPTEEPVVDPTKPVENMAAPDDKVKCQASPAELIKRALVNDQKRRNEIQAAVKIAKLDQSFADELCNSHVSIADANARIIERMATQPLGSSVGADVRVTGSGDDKFYDAVSTGLVHRAFKYGGFKSKPQEPECKDFVNTSLKTIASMFVERMGVKNVHNLPAPDVARIAMGHRPTMQRYRVERDTGYHSTGSFANLMLDAANKTLLAGYEEAPYTWSQWARQAQAVDDFKPINRIRLSEMSNPESVPEGMDYPETRMSDTKESYRVEKYGSIFSVTWETVVNDDLDALSRIPAAQGAACRRKQNAAVYGVLTANAAMADTGLLFNATAQTTAGGHDNYVSSGAAPTVAGLNTGYLSMMTKKGINSDVVLSIMPEFLIVPAALAATAMEILGSLARPEVGGSAAGNSNTHNIYGPNGQRQVRLIIEPVLDAASAKAWYLAASNTQVDTVELAFLAGEESPVLESEWGFDNDVYRYKVRQTFGVAAIDFRGLFKNVGE